MKEKNIGSSFDNWLREEGIYQKVTAAAMKRVVRRQLEAAMKEHGKSGDSDRRPGQAPSPPKSD